MYRHYDGYPKGHGIELAEFLRDFRVVNGLGSPSDKKIANGTSCLAAQIVAHFKTIPGNIYLYPCNDGEEGISWEDYTYTVWPKEGEPTWISIYSNLVKECIFVGTAENLIEKYAETKEVR